MVKKEGLHQKQKCLKRNVLKDRAELKRKSLIDGRVVLNRGWALFLFKRNNCILTGRAQSSIKQENPQYCEHFRNKVLRFKTSKVNRMNRIILTKIIVLTEFVFHLKNLSVVCTDDTHKNGRLFRGGVASIYIYIFDI